MIKKIRQFLYIKRNEVLLNKLKEERWNIKTTKETIEKIIQGYSISRYGDGEFDIAFRKKELYFQEYDSELSKYLREILNSNLEKLLVAIPRTLIEIKNLKENEKYFWSRYYLKQKEKLEKNISKDKVYFDSMISRFYMPYINPEENIESIDKLIKYFSNKKILIILDDIEREENLEKIYKSILFLGELSEYFKNTNVTILLLSQYDYLELAFIKALENKKTNSNSPKNSVYLDKYYKYRFRLNEPTIYDLNDSDLRLIIENIFKSVSSYGEKSSDENKNKFIASIVENLRNFFDIKNLNFHRSKTKKEIFPKDFQNKIYNIIRTLNLKMNIRLLEKSLQEILYLYPYYEETYIIYSIYIFMILKKNFIKDIEIRFHNSLDKDIQNAINLKNTMEFIEKNLLIHYVDSSLKFYSKIDVYSKLSQEIKSIIDTYNKGDVIVEEINITTSKIKEIILGTKNYENDFSLYVYNDYIYNLIKGDCLML